MGADILGVITVANEQLTLRLFSNRRRLVAKVIGSKRYVIRAMLAVWPEVPPAGPVAANDCEAP